MPHGIDYGLFDGELSSAIGWSGPRVWATQDTVRVDVNGQPPTCCASGTTLRAW